jgi:hypothetical protein
MSWLARARIARMSDPAGGTLSVTASTYPPTDVSARYASIRITGVVQAPGLPATAVQHTGTAPVAKWPSPGADLPVTVDRARPDHLVVDWDQLPSARDTALAAAEAEAAQLRTGLNPASLAEAIEQTTPGHAPAWSARLASGLPPAPGPRLAQPLASPAGREPAPATDGDPRPTLPPSTATEPVTGQILAVHDVPVPAAFAPPGGVADLTVAVPVPAGGEQTVICRVSFPTPAARAAAAPGATAPFLIDPGHPATIVYRM